MQTRDDSRSSFLARYSTYILILFASPFFSACDREPTAEELAARQEAELIREVQDKVRGKLADPGSAQFRDFSVFDRHGVVCGLVNAKNRMGSYAGSLQVVYVPGNEVLLIDDTVGWHNVCTNEEISDNMKRVIRVMDGIEFRK